MSTQLFHAHVQHPRGSGYMMQSGDFHNAKEAVERYITLVRKDENPFGLNVLKRYPESLQVTLIPAELHGPDVISYIGVCNIWDENGNDLYETETPDTVFQVANPLYQKQ